MVSAFLAGHDQHRSPVGIARVDRQSPRMNTTGVRPLALACSICSGSGRCALLADSVM
jgi:hypothetical protein